VQPLRLTPSIQSTAMTTMSILLLLLVGCSQAQVQAVASAVTDGLAALEANKAISEQFVREIKQKMPAVDPRYETIMKSYEQARDGYNTYLAEIETTARTGQRFSLTNEAVDGVADSTTEFISNAAKGLDPIGTKALQFRRAVILPLKLVTSVRTLPSGTRGAIADRVGADLHWKSWSQL
jgi:hypothetical protein